MERRAIGRPGATRVAAVPGARQEITVFSRQARSLHWAEIMRLPAAAIAAAFVLPTLACSSPPGSLATNPDDAGTVPSSGEGNAPGSASSGEPTASGDDAGTLTSPPGSAVPDAGLSDAGASSSGADAAPSPAGPRVVAYLPNYAGSYATWASSIDFTKMTHLNLAFATADSSNAWDMGDSDSDVAALVTAAHSHGVLVLASLGGGGGDQTVIAQYQNASNVPALVKSLDAFVASHDFDGVDIDIEDPSNLGAGYTTFVDAVVADLRPEGRLVTAAVAQYLQDSMDDATLHQFDLLNVMIYSDYSDSVSAMTYYAQTKSVPTARLNLGAGFFGSDSNGNEYAYSAILQADPDAWEKDEAQVNGVSVSYTGVASMQQLATYSKGYGGIMFWDLSQDAPGPHSLYAAIQATM